MSMEAFYPFATTQEQTRRYNKRQAFIQKAGSCSSPVMQCPTLDDDTISPSPISGSALRDVVPSVQSPPADLAQLAALPLFSPSEHTQQGDRYRQYQRSNDLDMALAFEPVSVELPTPPQDGPLRLPSFRRLGIDNPHPDHLTSSSPYVQEPPLSSFLLQHQLHGVEMQDGSQMDLYRESCFEADRLQSSSWPGGLKPSSKPSILTPPDGATLFDWRTQLSMSSQNDDFRRYSAATQASTSESQPATHASTSNETATTSMDTEPAQGPETSVLRQQDQEVITDLIRE